MSDGATTSSTGNPLLNSSMDSRAVLVLAYPDLDGDGFIGPTNADGSADNQMELQELQRPAGRQVGLITGGVANGSLGVALGAPASAGGLGLVLVAGAPTGPTPPLYDDGPWVATLLPFMLSPDPQRIIGQGRVLPPNPEGLVEVRLEPEKLYVPVGHPSLGTPFALPTDGSSPTIDLARAVAGNAVSAAFVQPINLATGASGTIYDRTFPAGAFVAKRSGKVFAFQDDPRTA